MKFTTQTHRQKTMNLLHKMRFCDYASLSKTRSSRRHLRQCSFYPNKTQIFGHTFLCCISASTRKSWLRRRPCGCGCPDEMKCQTTLKLKRAFAKTMKTHRKINISRLDLSTKEVARERPCVNVSFYLIKTHFFEVEPDIARRAHGALRAHSSRTCIP